MIFCFQIMEQPVVVLPRPPASQRQMPTGCQPPGKDGLSSFCSRCCRVPGHVDSWRFCCFRTAHGFVLLPFLPNYKLHVRVKASHLS